MVTAFVMVNVELGGEERVLDSIRKVRQTLEAYVVYGIYDLVVKVEAESMEALRNVVTGKLRTIQGVRSTLTLLVVEE